MLVTHHHPPVADAALTGELLTCLLPGFKGNMLSCSVSPYFLCFTWKGHRIINDLCADLRFRQYVLSLNHQALPWVFTCFSSMATYKKSIAHKTLWKAVLVYFLLYNNVSFNRNCFSWPWWHNFLCTLSSILSTSSNNFMGYCTTWLLYLIM